MVGRGAAALTAAMATLGLAACGAGTSVATGRTSMLHRAAPPPPAAAATPAPPRPDVLVVGNTAPVNGSVPVTLVRADGTVLGRASVPSAQEWSLSAGPQGAYWAAAGRLHRLDVAGHDTDLGALRPDQNSRIAVSPDASAWVYATSTITPDGVRTNRLWRGGVGGATQLLAERVDDPMHPTPGFPTEWIYSPKSWTAAGVLVVREPAGGCGCAPFDMETVSGSVVLVDPSSGATTPLSTDRSCPLSGAAVDATVVCFHSNGRGDDDELRLLGRDGTTQRFTLSGTTVGGDARFDAAGGTLAYATAPGGMDCGEWQSQTTLRILDVASGDARAVGPAGLQPQAWLGGGRIAALATGGGNPAAVSVVSLDVRSGALQTLVQGSGLYVVGVATGA